jgi:hypothetical protein
MKDLVSINPQTRKLLAMRHMGRAASEDLVAWAADILEAGIDSENVRILAGLIPPLYSVEVESYFLRCFNDLSWSFPEQEICLRQYTRDIAEAILADSISRSDGCVEMYKTYVELDYPPDLQCWSFICDDLDPNTYKELDEDAFNAIVLREAKALLARP